jgi:hypothetical protein
MMCSRPTKAPPQMNRTLVVSTGISGLLRALIAALRWHRGDCAFEHLEQGTLDAKPHVLEARTNRTDIVDLIDEQDAASGDIQVAIGRLDQL